MGKKIPSSLELIGDLKQWNREEFGNIAVKKQGILDEIKRLDEREALGTESKKVELLYMLNLRAWLSWRRCLGIKNPECLG